MTARQRHGAAPGRRRPPARLVDRRPGRLGGAAARRPCPTAPRSGARPPGTCWPTSWPPSLAFAVVAASPGARPGGGPHPAAYGSGRAAARAPGAGLRAGPRPAVPGRPAARASSGVVAKVVALRPVVARRAVAARRGRRGQRGARRRGLPALAAVLLGAVPGEQPVAAAGRPPALRGASRPPRPRTGAASAAAREVGRRAHPAVLAAVGLAVRRPGPHQRRPRPACCACSAEPLRPRAGAEPLRADADRPARGPDHRPAPRR